MQQVLNPIEVFNRIQEHAQSVKSDRTWVIENPEFGRPFPQGDLNFWFLRKLPEDAIETSPVSQLAPGNTRGSRHCIADSDMGNVRFFKLPNPNPLQGMLLKFSAPTRIEHPEHGDHIYPAGSIVAVTYQRRYADEIKRIED